MRKCVPLLLCGLLSGVRGFSLSAAEIKGRVEDASHNPLAKVRITVHPDNQVFYSDSGGGFVIPVTDESRKLDLAFDLDGYYSQTVEIGAPVGSTELSVIMTPHIGYAESVTVTASRVETPISVSPAATTVVYEETLRTMPRAVAAEEALKSVPGVKVDNQANGERVHLSIRGQGILTERGIRGIEILLDGLPLNDPTGFAPDLFDVDWESVDRIEVLRGPVAFLYGGGSAGGIISVVTREITDKRAAGEAWASGGSNGFWKADADLGGGSDELHYYLLGSHGEGDGYREHTAFWSNNVYGKLTWQPVDRFRLNARIGGTGYFNENAEGLNVVWLAEDRRMANPDALTYNEYQKTRRFTSGLTGQIDLSPQQNLYFTLYFRHTKYDESVPSSVQHRTLDSPGTSLQYGIDFGRGPIRNSLSAGFDLDRQGIDEFRHPNLGGAVEGPELVSDQQIHQRRLGSFVQDRIGLSAKWAVLLALRHDRIENELTDFLKLNGLDLSGDADFRHTTGRAGITWNPRSDFGLYAGWGQGFLPPATEELYANPAALGGFNSALKPATSQGIEVGARGSVGASLSYDLTVFHVKTHDDFERYRISSRPLETFYRNAGHSRRNGVETFLRWIPARPLTVQAAYTFSDFIYTQYYSITYQGNLAGNNLPNSPRHQASVEITYRPDNHWAVDGGGDMQSRSYIDGTNRTWIDGFALLNARVSYSWEARRKHGEIFLAGKNLTGKEYIAFTEPDPDGNSYQPGPTREVFAGLKFGF